MNRHIFFFILSIILGIGVYFYALPEILKNKFIFNFFEHGYQFVYSYLKLSSTTFLVLISFLIAFIIFSSLEVCYFIVNEEVPTTRGSARWASKKDVKELMVNDGVPIGKFNGKILRVKTHLVTCAGTRTGKGIGAIIPTLLEYKQSLICLDIKGENYAVTSRKRAEFSKVYAVNPFGVLDIPTASYNWLDCIDFNNNDYDTIAQLMASMIVGDSGKNLVDDHFDKMATILLKGVILFVCSEGNLKERNICTVADLIHTVPLDELCEQMAKKTDVAGGLISKIGLQFLNNPNDKEKGSILSTAQRVTGFLENENIKKTLIKSDFNIFDIPNELMSVYLIIEQDKIRDFSAYIRVFFSLALSSLISHKDKHKYEVLFLLDEIAQLGYMDIIAKAPAFIRGMGGQMWFFFQSYPQLQNYYGKMADDILNNSTQIFYGCNDIKTSELISKTLGQRTIKEWEGSSGKYHWIAKDLMTSDEVRRSSPENPIVFMTSKPPIKVKRLNYLKDHEYRGKFDKNPYFG